VSEQIDDDLVETLAAADDRISLPDEDERPDVDDDETSVWEAVCEELADQPAESWEDVNRQVIKERQQDAEDAQENYTKEVRNAVHELLDESDTVEVSVAGNND